MSVDDATAGIEVWCPRAERMELVTRERRMQMRRDGDFFRLGERLEHGQEYALSLDDGEPLPDPRSPWQPHGVHGASRHVDHARFAWSDEGFSPVPLSEAVIYELHVGTFTPEGHFDGAMERLDHLVELGVTHVEVMPVAAFPGARGWGYDGVALFAPFEGYGGPSGMKRFVDACHQRGLGVILDVVYNHFGPEGNYLERFGPYGSEKHHTPWGPGLNLDGYDAAEVRRFICDNARSWIRDYHVDGLRLDATHALIDVSAIHILESIADAALEAGAERGVRPALIAEALTNDPWVVRSREQHGLGLDAQWCDDFHHALHAALTDERFGGLIDFGGLSPLERCLTRGWHLDGRYSAHRRRPHGRPLALPQAGRTLVSYAQNHDQLGNRGEGKRLHHLVGRRRAKIAAALTLLGPGVPMLFMGEEWAAATPFLFFCDFEDRRLARAVQRGRARELANRGFSNAPRPGARATFEASVLDWGELDDADAADQLAWYRELVKLRREEPSLSSGELATCLTGEGWLVMTRGAITVAVNIGKEQVCVPVVGGEVILASPIGVDGSVLPSDAVVVWRGAKIEGGG